MKFLVVYLVGEVRGDQAKSRQCYAMSTRVVEKHKMVNTIFHLEDVDIPPSPSSISYTLGQLDPREKETEKRGSLIEELKSIKLDDQHPEHTVQIGLQLSGSLQDQLINVLKEHKDIFAWFHEDMLGIDPLVIVHRLNVDPAHKPVIQKHHRFNPKRYTTISEEVNKLLKAKFIWEAHYLEWLANVVMVKKPNEKWRICINYTDLNKACPKDSFPLPRIDQLVDATTGHELLCFMDAYSRYNQIHMCPEDEDKTTFTMDYGLYCYKVMSFSLKNTRATYQQVVNKVFANLISKTMEVYVDDMLVKSL